MKVVLFCGGLGTRIREYPEPVPKPMVTIGYRPILWHVMKYYAHFGHTDFVLCLGYKADAIKNYFLKYDECVSNNFVLSDGGRKLQLLNSDIHDWRITFVDTGVTANVGQRLRAVAPYLEGEDVFLANYSDGLSDLPLPSYVDQFVASGKVASLLAVVPNQTSHLVTVHDGLVTSIVPITQAGVRINGGFFAFRQEIFGYIEEGEELVEQPFQRLIQANQLLAHPCRGFWACMDTFKDRQQLEDIYNRGEAPWEVWNARNRLPTAELTPGGKPPQNQTLVTHA